MASFGVWQYSQTSANRRSDLCNAVVFPHCLIRRIEIFIRFVQTDVNQSDTMPWRDQQVRKECGHDLIGIKGLYTA